MLDYLALIHRFAAEGVIGEMDCIYTSWATDEPTGFSDHDIVTISRLSAGSASPSNPRRLRASPRPWWKLISAATPAGGCSAAPLPAALPRRSKQSVWYS